MRLYTFAASSAAYRARIALNLKGVAPDYAFVHLTKDGGQQHSAAYAAVNPQEMVPTLEDQGRFIGQSLAIMEYLDDVIPQPPLLPREPGAKARVRQIAYTIACDIHPLNNLRVRQYLSNDLRLGEAEVGNWYRHWIDVGFEAIESMLAQSAETGRYCHGDQVTMADICLVPQVANARRFRIPLGAYPTIERIDAALRALPAFIDAAPENQPDAA